jgi:hypothetical protein
MKYTQLGERGPRVSLIAFGNITGQHESEDLT